MAVPPMLVALLEGFRIRLLDQAVKRGQQTGFERVLLRFDRTEKRGRRRCRCTRHFKASVLLGE
jgi:hypothetical protein